VFLHIYLLTRVNLLPSRQHVDIRPHETLWGGKQTQKQGTSPRHASISTLTLFPPPHLVSYSIPSSPSLTLFPPPRLVSYSIPSSSSRLLLYSLLPVSDSIPSSSSRLLLYSLLPVSSLTLFPPPRPAGGPPLRWSCCTPTATPPPTRSPWPTSPVRCRRWPRRRTGEGTRAHRSGTTLRSPPASPLKWAACKSRPPALCR